MKFDIEIISAQKCPYCGKKPKIVDSSIVYGRSFGPIYLCRPCWAWVGTHKSSNEPLGRLADEKLREAKKKAHFWFDVLWKNGIINKVWREYLPDTSNREKAYIWLSDQLKIARKYCHIGMMDVDGCEKIVSICKPVIEKHGNESDKKRHSL